MQDVYNVLTSYFPIVGLQHGRTALHYAANYGKTVALKLCLQLGCELDLQDKVMVLKRSYQEFEFHFYKQQLLVVLSIYVELECCKTGAFVIIDP